MLNKNAVVNRAPRQALTQAQRETSPLGATSNLASADDMALTATPSYLEDREGAEIRHRKLRRRKRATLHKSSNYFSPFNITITYTSILAIGSSVWTPMPGRLIGNFRVRA
jgi:hypothetical protein